MAREVAPCSWVTTRVSMRVEESPTVGKGEEEGKS